MRVATLFSAALGAVLLCPFVLLAQTRTDYIKGRVTSDGGKAIALAEVIATRAPDRAVFRDTTDAQGYYTLVITPGTGDYLLHVSVPGAPQWSVFRRRITRDSSGDAPFVVDVVLKAQRPHQIEAVRVVATRPTPGVRHR